VAELVRGWGSLAAVTALLVGLGADYGLVLGLALGYGAGAVLGLLGARRETRIGPRFDRAVSGEALRFGLRGQVGNIFQFLGVRLDLLLVPAFLDLTATGIYFVAVRVSDVVGQVATAAASLVFPQVAGQVDRRATATTERVVRATLLAVAASALLIGLLAEPILGIAFGPTYVAGASVLLIALVATVPLSLGRMLAADLKGRGRPGLVSLSALLSVGTTLLFDVLLIPALGIQGAAIAALLSHSLTATALLIAYHGVTDGRIVDLVPRPSDVRMLLALRRGAARAEGGGT
jgi:O-antigen/teichoic acid export membrane protein